MNCVFEDVWQDGDDEIFEKQLIMLADEMIDNELYTDCECSIIETVKTGVVLVKC